MLTEKEKRVYESIKKFIKKNNYSPTIRELSKILVYKSTRTIHMYLQKLKEKNYITYNNKPRSIIINNEFKKNLLIINTKKVLEINFDEHIIIYQINNDYFKKDAIKRNDYLIINTKSHIKNNDLGLFIINKDYRIMKYNYIDGFYILEDKEQLIVCEIKLIGKVVGVYRMNIKNT